MAMQQSEVSFVAHRNNRRKKTVANSLTSARVVARSGANYTATLIWLIRRSIDGHKLKVSVVFALGQLSLSSQAAAIFTLYWYAEKTQSDAVVSLSALGIELRAREDPMLLLIVVAASVICFLASAGFVYISRSMVLSLGQEEVACGLTQLIGIARRLPDPRAPVASEFFIRGGLKKVDAGCKMGGMATVILLNVVTPVVGGVVAVGVLVWIDAVLTTMIVIAAVLWSTLLYPLTQRQLMFARSRGREGKAFKEEARALLQAPPSTATPEKLDSAVRVAEVFLGRRRVTNEMVFVLQIGVTLIGALAAFYLATSIMGGSGDWPIFIVYLGGLRIALGGCFAAPRTFGIVSRFYPNLSLFVRFLQSAAKIDREVLGHVRNGDAVMLGSLPDGTEVSIRSGDRLALATLNARPELDLAFLRARAADTGCPLATAHLDAADLPSQKRDIPIAVMEVGTLTQMGTAAADAFLHELRDSVALIVYRDTTHVGTFGERHLIVVDGGAITTFVPLGVAESRAALERFAGASPGVRKHVPESVQDEQEEDEDETY